MVTGYLPLDLRKRLRHAIWRRTDTCDDWLYKTYPYWYCRHDNLITDISEKLERRLCRALAHIPVPDHCNIPEHDHCAYCQTSLPGQGR